MEYFKNIIGYEHIKKELNRIIDCINNKEKYEKLGVKIPKNLLIYGNPGVGKTTFSKAFLEALNRNKYIIRKDKPDGEFVNHINKTINEAINHQPAVILLDDIDKFSNNDDDHKNSDEFVVVQSFIDDCKDKDIYFIATANSLRAMPRSLLREGRFDTKIEIENPTEQDSALIIEYYLRNKRVSNDINYLEIARILSCRTCATLETIINEAGLYAGFNNKDIIEKEDILEGCLRVLYDSPKNDSQRSKLQLEIASYHEAGHALVSEILEPNSVNLVTVENYFGNTGGITSSTKNEDYWYDIRFMENRIMVLLAGKAAIEVAFNKVDVGVSSDVDRACEVLLRMHEDYYVENFNHVVINRTYAANEETSGSGKWMILRLQDYYKKSKEIVFDNKDKLEIIAKELIEKHILLQSDMERIIRG